MTEREDFLCKAGSGGTIPVARVFPSDATTPVLLMRRLRASGEECFLLESVEGGETLARYTFLGCGPVARISIRDSQVELERGGTTERLSGSPFEALSRLVVRPDFRQERDLPPLASGAVGFLGYDAVRLFEEIPDRHERTGRIPDGLFLLFDAVVAFDHPRQRVMLLTTLDSGESAESAADGAIARLDRLEALLWSGAGERRPAAATQNRPPRGEFETVMPKVRFLEAVERAREAIFAGDIYQVVLSQRWHGPLDVDPFEVYRALRMGNPSPYLFYLETREAAIFGSSPEMLLRCRDRSAETRAIAGTMARGDTAAEDETLASRLRADPKERSEHVMLVDLGRNDLGRVCELGSVEVPRYADVEKYSHVQHLVSEVRGRLAAGKSSLDALAACFPAGTLTGAPKIRAMELIDELEASRRGVYGGAVGYLDVAGSLDMAIAIRTAVVEQGICRIQAGAGIVADSVAETEYAECEAKAQALFRAIETARGWPGVMP
jgi:anthranilate synthase component 1